MMNCWSRHRNGDGGGDHARHADAKVALLHFDLAEIRVGDQVRQLADEIGIERVFLGHGATSAS